MQEMTAPQSNAHLGYLLSEMLALPTLPDDLHNAITAHLQQQLNQVNILKPEYCLRLYPVLAELSQLAAINGNSQIIEVIEADQQVPVEPTELADGQPPAEASGIDDEESAFNEAEVTVNDQTATAAAEPEPATETEIAETVTAEVPAGVLAGQAEVADGPRTIW